MDQDLSLRGREARNAPVATLCAMFDHAVATAPDKVALRHLDVALTYREVGRAVAALAHRLAPIVAPGEVVTLVLPNSIEFHIAYFAALKVLATPALLNPSYPAAQLSPLLREASPGAVVCAPATRDMVAGLAEDLGIPGAVCLGQDIAIRELVAQAEAPLALRTATPTDPGALLFSGGTTGLPKAVEQTHGRLVTAVRCVQHIWPTRADSEVFLPIAPFTHIYGFLLGVLVRLSARGETVIPERFQPEHIVELLAHYRVTFFGGGPPAIYAGVLAARNLRSAHLPALSMCPAGGAPFPVELMERWRCATGLEIYEAYGMSEMAPISGTTAVSGVRPGSSARPCLAPTYKSWTCRLDFACCRQPPRARPRDRFRRGGAQYPAARRALRAVLCAACEWCADKCLCRRCARADDHSTAFTIEIFRGGFAAIPAGQYEAARALGLSRGLILRLVVVPQVFRIVLPTLGNQIVSVVLGSAQASIIGVGELTYETLSVGSATFRYFELFTIAALFYIVCVQLIGVVWRVISGRAARAPLGI